MERIEVSATTDFRGQVMPRSFTWKGKHYAVEACGRRWEAPDGLHILVMSRRSAMFELRQSPDHDWFLVQAPATVLRA